jgi:hypothetical protein
MVEWLPALHRLHADLPTLQSVSGRSSQLFAAIVDQ